MIPMIIDFTAKCLHRDRPPAQELRTDTDIFFIILHSKINCTLAKENNKFSLKRSKIMCVCIKVGG